MKRKIDEPAMHRCGEYLAERGLKLMCAESMTAGFLSSTWALEVCSGNYYLGSIVCYDDSIKKNLLSKTRIQQQRKRYKSNYYTDIQKVH